MDNENDTAMQPIPNHSGYFVTIDGAIYSTRRSQRPVRLKAIPSGGRTGANGGALAVGLSGGKKVAIGTCVWSTYRGPVPDGMVVDHIDRDPRNNHVSNLRLATREENARNRTPGRGSSSRFIGVYRAGNGRWRAQIRKDGRKHCIGTFESETEAARARDAQAKRLFGEFASLNIPDPLPQVGPCPA